MCIVTVMFVPLLQACILLFASPLGRYLLGFLLYFVALLVVFLVFCMTSAHVRVDGMFSGLYTFSVRAVLLLMPDSLQSVAGGGLPLVQYKDPMAFYDHVGW